MKPQEGSKYDLVVKDLFQRDHPSLLDELTGGVPVRHVLGSELARVEGRRADLILLLADETILHIEFQSGNDKDMPYREGIYCLMIGQKYRRRVRQVVLYIGQAKMRMVDHVYLDDTRYTYRLMDIREMNAEKLMTSGRPGDLVLALLADGGPERLMEIAKRVGELRGAERERILAKLLLLSGLRQVSEKLTMELKAMDATRDILKNVFVMDAIRDDRAKVFRGLLVTKFGRLPGWVDELLDAAKADQLQRWSNKAMLADTLEGVLGKRKTLTASSARGK